MRRRRSSQMDVFFFGMDSDFYLISTHLIHRPMSVSSPDWDPSLGIGVLVQETSPRVVSPRKPHGWVVALGFLQPLLFDLPSGGHWSWGHLNNQDCGGRILPVLCHVLTKSSRVYVHTQQVLQVEWFFFFCIRVLFYTCRTSVFIFDR